MKYFYMINMFLKVFPQILKTVHDSLKYIPYLHFCFMLDNLRWQAIMSTRIFFFFARNMCKPKLIRIHICTSCSSQETFEIVWDINTFGFDWHYDILVLVQVISILCLSSSITDCRETSIEMTLVWSYWLNSFLTFWYCTGVGRLSGDTFLSYLSLVKVCKTQFDLYCQ